jgi:LmbE family N-acetylglucosaminyl deacetylase
MASDPSTADRTIAGPGTAEAEWDAWPGWSELTSVGLDDLVPAGTRLVVVAPHPDDEVIAAGGLLSLAAAAGRSTLIIGVSDGGGSHPGSTEWPPGQLVERRRAERRAALHELGVRTDLVCELDLPDGGISAARKILVGYLDGLVRDGDVVISPWRFDGHPDHEATTCAVHAVIAAKSPERHAVHLQAPIWGWHWASPSGGQLPAAGGAVLPLDSTAHRRKIVAMSCFTSQLSADASTGAPAILPDFVLQRLSRHREVFLR